MKTALVFILIAVTVSILCSGCASDDEINTVSLTDSLKFSGYPVGAKLEFPY